MHQSANLFLPVRRHLTDGLGRALAEDAVIVRNLEPRGQVARQVDVVVQLDEIPHRGLRPSGVVVGHLGRHHGQRHSRHCGGCRGRRRRTRDRGGGWTRAPTGSSGVPAARDGQRRHHHDQDREPPRPLPAPHIQTLEHTRAAPFGGLPHCGWRAGSAATRQVAERRLPGGEQLRLALPDGLLAHHPPPQEQRKTSEEDPLPRVGEVLQVHPGLLGVARWWQRGE